MFEFVEPSAPCVRCPRSARYVDEQDTPYCAYHLRKNRRKVRVSDLMLCTDQRFVHKPLRVTTLEKCTDSCPVCMETCLFNSVVLEVCGHRFHETCIKEWAFSKNSCPVCRAEVFYSEAQDPNLEDLYSVMDVLESPAARAHAREAHDDAFLTTRAYTYEGAVSIALAVTIGA